MKKYINSEKLKAIIKAQIKEIKEWMKDLKRKLMLKLKKQPKVDLEKEIEQYTEETIHLPITHKRTPMDIMESDWVRCAHHFYKLGKNSK